MPGFLFLLMLVQSAGFQQGSGGACADLVRLEQIALHAYEARYAYGERQFRLEMQDIAALSTSLSLTGVIPAGDNANFQKHQQSLEKYLEGHKSAVRLYTSGNKDAAMAALRTANTRRAWRARTDLTNFWSCQKEVGSASYQNYRDRPRRSAPPVDKLPKIKKPKTTIPAWKITLLRMQSFAGQQKDKLVNVVAANLPEKMQEKRIAGSILGSSILFVLTFLIGLRIWKNGERSNRQPCHIPARLVAQSGNYQISVIDIGRAGAKIQGGPDLQPKTQMRLIIGDESYKGRSVWSNGEYAGIAFEKRLSPQSLSGLLEADESVSLTEEKEKKIWPYQLVA